MHVHTRTQIQTHASTCVFYYVRVCVRVVSACRFDILTTHTPHTRIHTQVHTQKWFLIVLLTPHAGSPTAPLRWRFLPRGRIAVRNHLPMTSSPAHPTQHPMPNAKRKRRKTNTAALRRLCRSPPPQWTPPLQLHPITCLRLRQPHPRKCTPIPRRQQLSLLSALRPIRHHLLPNRDHVRRSPHRRCPLYHRWPFR